MLVLRARKSQELIQSSVLRPSLPCSLECGCCYGFPIGAGAPGPYGEPWWECGCFYGFPIGAGAPGRYGEPWWECGCFYGFPIAAERTHPGGRNPTSQAGRSKFCLGCRCACEFPIGALPDHMFLGMWLLLWLSHRCGGSRSIRGSLVGMWLLLWVVFSMAY